MWRTVAGAIIGGMQLAIAIPQFVADGEFDPPAFRSYMRRAEELGFDSAWTQELVLGRMPVLESIEVMTYAAACTDRIRLGCVVLVTTLRNPVHLADSLATLDQLSRGRLEVVGLGRPETLPAFGIDPDSRVTRFNEGLRLIKALWTEPRVTFEGRFWHLDQAASEPKPFQKPHPRIWFGGGHPAALQRAVRHGDAFFGAGSAATAQFAEQVRTLRALLEGAGRDPAGFPIAKRVYVAVDDDASHADPGRRLLRSPLRSPGHDRGRRLRSARGLHPRDQGGGRGRAGLILFTTMFDQLEQMERLAAEVVPHLSR